MSHVEGLNMIFANLQAATMQCMGEMDNRLQLAGAVLHDQVKFNASLTDHTQEDLDEMGNPYARRKPEDNEPHYDDSLVHRQTGTLYNDIIMETVRGNNMTSVSVGVPSSNSRIENLINGAPKQRPRPFIQRAAEIVKDDMEVIIAG